MATKDYSNASIVVHWDATRCIHTGICTRSLPGVFDVTKRPWITVDAASADDVARTVAACPTGALRYDRLDGTEGEAPPEVTTIVPMRNGPLYLRGRLRVTTPQGEVVTEETRLALCRCGATANPPFCDNAHRGVGYRSPEPTEPLTSDARTPLEVCEPQEF